VSVVKRVESVVILRGQWCDTAVLIVHGPMQDRTDDMKHSFYKELECVFNKILKCNLKILL
jgi:hypothetical protein